MTKKNKTGQKRKLKSDDKNIFHIKVKRFLKSLGATDIVLAKNKKCNKEGHCFNVSYNQSEEE